jgi:hypothetical protein
MPMSEGQVLFAATTTATIQRWIVAVFIEARRDHVPRVAGGRPERRILMKVLLIGLAAIYGRLNARRHG